MSAAGWEAAQLRELRAELQALRHPWEALMKLSRKCTISLLAVAVFLIPSSALARQRFWGMCAQGGHGTIAVFENGRIH